jgi:PKD repeat protein
MKSHSFIIITVLLLACLVGSVSAVTWTSSNGCWTATNGSTYLVMWNATGSKTFTAPPTTFPVSYLIIAGGASGGSGASGGGGAGGMRNGTVALTAGSTYSLTVGAGGSAVIGNANGINGTNSSFVGNSSTGGGYGSYGASAAATGGSGGGGGSGGAPGAGNKGVYTPMEGFTGGTGAAAGNVPGGGGGAGGAGIAGAAGDAGDGGAGGWSDITKEMTQYAGGGGGGGTTYTLGFGGGGGGGDGGRVTTPLLATPGVNGTGSGGGGNYNTSAYSGSGGSGIVIMSYGIPAPVASFALSPINGTQPQTVQFTDASTGTPTSWSWGRKNLTPGDNTWVVFSNAQNPSTPFYYGNWSVNLTATNSGGSNISTQNSWVNVSTGYALAADFIGVPASGYAPVTTHFIDMSTGDGLYDWAWDFGDTGTSALRNPSHTYTAAGNYDVSLTVKGFGGTTVTTKTGYVSVLYPFSTYSDPLGYIFANGADNKINFYDFKTAIDGKSIEIMVSGSYEVA